MKVLSLEGLKSLYDSLKSIFVKKDDISENPQVSKIPVYDNNILLAAKGIKIQPYSLNILEVGWYRVYTSTTATSRGHHNILLNIGRDYYNYTNESYTFSINVTNSACNIILLSGYNEGKIITKIRVLTKSNSYYYIDVYYSRIPNNVLYISGIGPGNFHTPELVEETIPDGYTLTEFETGNGLRNEKDGLVANRVGTTQLIDLDLDDYHNVGSRIFWGNTSNKCKNKPAEVYAFLLLCNNISSDSILILYDPYGVIYRRTYDTVHKTWYSWKRLLTEDDLPKTWVGTEVEYNALTSKDSKTIYYITE